MNYLDDLPKRDSNHDIQETAEVAFLSAIHACGLFIKQQEDRCDYGTDFQLEVKDSGEMTNVRVHVQVKGTECDAKASGSISRTVARTNLNYLLRQSSSFYICYHLPSERLLVRYSEDVYREYEHRGNDWRHQDTITVSFTQLFDDTFQTSLKNKILADAISSRDHRLQFVATPPEQIPALIQTSTKAIFVPADIEQAKKMLSSLYEAGNDVVISNSFKQFSAVLNSSFEVMMLAYMAEINLGVNGLKIDENRVRQGVDVLNDIIEMGCFETGSLLYSIGNGWLALGDYEKSCDVYRSALRKLDKPELSHISAQCNKNMGSVMEKLGKEEEAVALYRRALQLDPKLNEAHFAIALCCRREGNFTKTLDHLDQVVFLKDGERHNSTLQGWRIEALFNVGDVRGAFREINSLITQGDNFDWIWYWCARQVADFGRGSLESVQRALQFWDIYLQKNPEHIPAVRERLLCFWYKQSLGEATEINFGDFKQAISELIDCGDPDVAFLWDRVGHWAQYDEDWIEAEECYRKAYNLEPKQYGYCLGTALNFLDRHAEALPILLRQAEEYLPDAMSWFQLAVAREGVGDIEGCITAYQQSIELDVEYNLAWFNLGGIYWNSGDIDQAIEIWSEAVERFPAHELAEKLRRDLPSIFDVLGK